MVAVFRYITVFAFKVYQQMNPTRFVKIPSIVQCCVGFAIFLLNVLTSKILHIHYNTTYLISLLVYSVLVPFILAHIRGVKVSLQKRHEVLSIVLALMFSQFICIGESFHFLSNWSLCFGTKLSIIIWILKTMLYAYIGILVLRYGLYKFSLLELPCNEKEVNIKEIFYVNLNSRFFCFLLFYPALFDFDAGFGLRTMLDSNEVVSNHHPYFVQWIHSIFWRLGALMHSPSFGMAILTSIYIVLSTAVVLYLIKTLIANRVPSKYVTIIGYIFALFPLFPILSVYPTKDSFFTYSFLLYTTTVYSIFNSDGAALKKLQFKAIHALSILLLCLTRHQGIYIVLVESLLLLIIFRRYIMHMMLSIFPSIVLYFLITIIILPSLCVEPVNKKELYGVLFQQTAYYLRNYSQDVTSEELTIINNVINTEEIVEAYKPNITDDVKSCYIYSEGLKRQDDNLLHFRHVDHSGEDAAINAYRRVWFTLFKRHPLCCIEATTAVIMGNFYNMGLSIINFDNTWYDSQATVPKYAFNQFSFFSKLFSKIIGYCANLPLASFLFAIPYYVWITLLLLMLLIINRDMRGIALFFPVILSIGVLLLSPVSSARYLYPIIITLPLLNIYILQSKRNTK